MYHLIPNSPIAEFENVTDEEGIFLKKWGIDSK
jgi:hypothetical protein